MAAADARANGSSNGNGASPNGNGTTPRVSLEQLSFPGTPRGQDGLTTPDEYLRELQDPIRRMEIFEEMGDDGAVATAIEARCQDVYAANWELTTEDKSDAGAQIRDFIDGEIGPVLEDLLRWLAEGPLQYGFVSIEPVFGWKDATDGERRLGLLKLAHMRQVTCEIHITESGELDYIQQHVWTGTSQKDPKIPAVRLIVRTLKREGADYYGKPPLRKFYREWKFKTQLERINVAHFDRFGVGIPVLHEPEGGLTEPERTVSDQWLEKLRSGLTNRARFPFGTEFEIKTTTGEMAGAELAWVQEYNSRIQKIILTQGVDLGTTQTGSRAVGETFADQLQGAVQADAENIAAIILEQLIKPLVILNFGEQETYPGFSPSARAKATSALFTNLTQAKAAGVLHPRPEDEIFIRDVMGLPAVDLETLKQEQEQRDIQAAAIAAAPPGSPASSAAGQGDRPPSPAQPKPGPQRVAASRDPRSELLRQLAYDGAAGGPTPAVPGESSHRTVAFGEWEQRVLRPDVLMRDLDLHAARATGEVQDALRAIDEELAEKAATAAALGAKGLRDAIPSITVSERRRKALRQVLLAAAQRSRDYGESAVYQEIQRQIGPEGVGPQRSPRYPAVMPSMDFNPASAFARNTSRIARVFRAVMALATLGTDGPHPRDLQLEAEVDRIVEDEIDRREGSTRAALGTALAQAATAAAAALVEVVRQLVTAALLGLSTGRTQSNVQSVVNVGFGIGRSDAADAVNAAVARASGAPVALPDNRVVAPDGTVDRTVTDAEGGTATEPSGERITPSGGRGGGARSGLVDANGDPIELDTKIYSAVMDGYTCDECAKWDGAEFPIWYPEDLTGVQCPNPRCEGGYAKCRCVWIYRTSKEVAANVPASKGPIPLSRQADDAVIAAVKADFEAKLTQLRADLAAKPDATPQPISIALTIEAPKPGTTTRHVEMVKGPDGKLTADVTEVPNG